MTIRENNKRATRLLRTVGAAALLTSGAVAAVGTAPSAQAEPPPPPFTCEGDPVQCSTYGDELLNLHLDKGSHTVQFDVGVDGSLPAAGPIEDVAVVLEDLSHTRPDDIDIMLESPDGKRVVLMSDACGAADLVDRTVTITDSATAPFPDAAHCVTKTDFEPADYPTSADNWNLGGEPTGTTMAHFDGDDPNGHWKMQIRDDSAGDQLVLGGVYLMFRAGNAQCQGHDVTVDVASGDDPTPGDDVILGTDGPDSIYGLAGDDIICGLGGDDLIRGGKGNDALDGGAGRDVASYNESEQPVTVNLALVGKQNTGVSTGLDTLVAMEDVYGGAGDDNLTGNGGDNRLWGFEGADTVKGMGGNDTVYGNLDGPDTCDGGPGTDIAGGGCEVKLNIP